MASSCVTVKYLSSAMSIGLLIFFFKQKTAYEMRISDWSSDVCSSDLQLHGAAPQLAGREDFRGHGRQRKIGGEHGHLQQDAARALGVDQQQVIERRQHRQQMA